MKKAPQQHPRVGTGILIRKGNKLLFGLRKGSHGAGTWCPPGGGLHMYESLEACIRREVQEEAGIKIKNLRFMAISNDIFKKNGKHYVTVEFTADWASGEAKVMEPDKCERWEWFAWDKLPKPMFSTTRNFIKQGYNPFNDSIVK